MNIETKKVLFNLIAIVILLSLFPFSCFALNTGFTVDDLENVQIVFDNLELSLIDEPIINYGFSCFDVNETGNYAIGFGNKSRDTVLVYDSNGTYLYGFSFRNSGSLGLEWDNDILILHLVRSDLAVAVDKNGNCLDIAQIKNVSQNDDYWRNEILSNKRNVNGSTYVAEHWLFNNTLLHWGSYQRLTKSTPDGKSVLLFDTTDNIPSVVWLVVICIGISLVSTVTALVIYKRGHSRTGG